jgi:CBS domain containing-hemolysin-like protein
VVGLTLGVGLMFLVLHMGAVCLTRALRSYSRSRLEDLAERRGRPERADEVARHDERTERAAEVMSVLTGLLLAAELGMVAGRLSPSVSTEMVVVIALLVAIAGYVAAGLFGRVHAESVLLFAWPAAVVLRTLMAPATALMRWMEGVASRRSSHLSHTPRPASVEVEVHLDDTEDEEGFEAELPESVRTILEQAVELARRDVYGLMTPRSSLRLLPASVSSRDAGRAFADSGLSRIPLFGEHRDDIVGVLYAKDLLAALAVAEDGVEPVPRKLVRPVPFVPETKNALELLDEFRGHRVQMALVLDEFGTVTGLVTLEDLLEELVGEIDDEHDPAAASDPIAEIGPGRYEVEATMPVEDLNERLGLRLPTDEDYATLGGLVFSTLGHVPESGASFRLGSVGFQVLSVVGRSIRRVGIDLNPAPGPSPTLDRAPSERRTRAPAGE